MLEIVNYIDFVIFVNICKEKICLKKKKILWYYICFYSIMLLEFCMYLLNYIYINSLDSLICV